MSIVNKPQFTRGKDVEAFLDDFFRADGWQITQTTPHEERALCLGDRRFARDGSTYLVEYKSGIQTFYTGNLFLETVSVDTAQKPGWVYTCRADFIFYATVLNGFILVFRPERLRAEIESLKQQFRTAVTSGNQNDGYNTHGVLVPLEYAKTHLAEKIISL